MSYDFGNLMMLCFILGVLTSAIEAILQATWNRLYLTKGLAIIMLRFPSLAIRKGLPFLSELKDEFPFSANLPFIGSPLPEIVFREVGNHTLAFRERLFSRRIPIGLMHGLLEFNPKKKQVIVVGIVSWFSFWFVAGIIFGVINLGVELSSQPNTSNSLILFLMIAVMAYLYRVGKVRLAQVGKTAADLWSASHD
jgi:hypothetical protein